MKTLISEIAKNCNWHKTVKDEFVGQCDNNIYKLQNMLPHGSGIDSGCKIDVERSSSKKVVILFSFHFMDENGYYCGWEDYKLIVVPSLFNSFDLKIYGKNKRQIKDYLYDLFDCKLREIVKY